MNHISVAEITFRPLKKWEGFREMIVCARFEPIRLSPLTRGSLLWLREQALQAENDPNREWDGLRAEWKSLLEGTHTDPHPELIILGHPTDSFDPSELPEQPTDLFYFDHLAYRTARDKDPRDRVPPYPRNSQQLYAGICRTMMESLLRRDLNSNLQFNDTPTEEN